MLKIEYWQSLLQCYKQQRYTHWKWASIKNGNYFASDKEIKNLEENDRIIFRYCDEKGLINESTNPNGSKNNIAGIINDKGNVLGMMPHPERSINASFYEMKGLNIFKSLYEVLL